jgi:glycosyltransferase involved in cell wall biosynthesis
MTRSQPECNTPPGSSRNGPKLLSVIIPAYNEERFIGTLLKQVQDVDLSALGVDKEIIVVDDHSTDKTSEIVRGFEGVTLKTQPVNGGKGAAVRAGIALARGDYLIIQDADLEYDPNDYRAMLEMLQSGQADAVYGSRYIKHPRRGKLVNLLTGKHSKQTWSAYLGGQSLSFVGWFWTGRYLSDTVTALKLFKREVIIDLELQTSGFELDHEISSKVLSRGYRIKEVPISYFPRSKAEGKKIGMRDWFMACRTFARYRNG